jgi:hypothetical protein
LSRYAPSDFDDDEKKQDCFKDGLHPRIHYALSSNDYPIFQKLVDKAFAMEKERKILEADRKRKMSFQGQSSSNNTRPRFNQQGQVVHQGSQYQQQRNSNQGTSQYRQQVQPQQPQQ